MKTKKVLSILSTACLIFIITFAACKKDKPVDSSTTVSDSQPTRHNYIKQKLFEISAEQSFKMITELKNYGQTQNKTANLIAADSVKLDSAIYVLEAALNFDFDDEQDTINVPIDTDTTSYAITFDDSNGKVTSAELQDAYMNLKSQIIDLISTDQVQIVDINAYLNGNATQVIFDAEVAKIAGFGNPCGNVNANSSPWLTKFNNKCLSGNPSYDAVFLINQRLACSLTTPLANCGYGAYWDNIKNVNAGQFVDEPTWMGTASPLASFLFYSGHKLWNSTTFGHCAQSYKNLTASQVNVYVAAAQTELIAKIPSTPANVKISQAWYEQKWSPCSCQNSDDGGIMWWNMRCKYSVQKCRVSPR